MRKIKKKQYDMILKFVQDVIKSIPVFLLGSGASCAVGIPGMGELANYLDEKLKEDDVFKKEWNEVKNNLDLGLELALQKSGASNDLTTKLSCLTADFIRKEDIKIYKQILCDEKRLPLAELFNYIFTGNVKYMDVITTNYDRIIEYSCDISKIPYYTGFNGGYYKEFNISQSRQYFNKRIRKNLSNRRAPIINETIPHIRIYKLHGSVDWFENEQKLQFCSHYYDDRMNFKPLVITPGVSKYYNAHMNPYREIISLSDQAIRNGKNFIIIGYGFNDEHLEPLLREKIKSNYNKILVITRTLTDSARKALVGTRNTLILCKQEDNEGTYCYINDEEFLIDESLWVLDNFIKMVEGGFNNVNIQSIVRARTIGAS